MDTDMCSLWHMLCQMVEHTHRVSWHLADHGQLPKNGRTTQGEGGYHTVVGERLSDPR
jgi:hypothetical protein